MSAEAIARLVRALRRGNYRRTPLDHGQEETIIARAAVVHITAIYDAWMAEDTPIDLYADSVCRPPLLDAIYGWENQHGNVIVAVTLSIDRERVNGDWSSLTWEPGPETAHSIDWSLVEWVTSFGFYLGGRDGDARPFPATGPVAMVMAAVNADGTVQDFHWVLAHEQVPMDLIGLDVAIVARAITFLNCRNVIVCEPTGRSRPERRRIERTGVTVNEIHVTPIGQTHKGRPRQPPIPLTASGPLSMVRGHVARYGPKWGRGLLFGKYEGEYWISQHHRGSADAGEIEHEYVTEAAL